VLISLVDHGVTPSALAARLTYSSAPEALQGAVAAGLLGAGTVLLGSMEAAGQLLDQIAETGTAEGARQVVQSWRDAGRRIPGLGHALHKEADPRADPLLRVADDAGLSGRYVAAVRGLPEAMEAATGHRLPLNATGAVAALLLELGLPWQMHRGVALASRAVGLLAHVMDEAADPISPALREAFRAGPDGGEA
jgi:citrate synthase